MSEQFSKMKDVFSTLFYQVILARRIVGVVAITATTTLCLGHLSSGRQIDHSVITRRLVIAETFVLGSSGTKSTAILGLDPAKQIAINFMHMESARSLQIGVFKEGAPALSLNSAIPKTRMALSLLPSAKPSLRLSGSTPKSGLDLRIRPEDTPAFTIGDTNETRMSISVSGSSVNPVVLALSDRKGREVIRLSHSKNLTSLSLFDAGEHLRTIIGLLPGKAPGFLLYNSGLIPLIEMTTNDESKPLIRLNDPVARESQTFK